MSKAVIAIVLALVLLVAGVLALLYSSRFALPETTTTTVTATPTNTITLFETLTITLIAKTTVATTLTVSPNSTAQTSFPFAYPEYLTTYCSGGGTSGNGPCFTNDFSEAYVFDCGNSSASESGCMQVVTSTILPSNYTINIRFPYVTQANEPAWANCFYSVKGFPSTYAYCILIGQGSFILSQQGALPA